MTRIAVVTKAPQRNSPADAHAVLVVLLRPRHQDQIESTAYLLVSVTQTHRIACQRSSIGLDIDPAGTGAQACRHVRRVVEGTARLILRRPTEPDLVLAGEYITIRLCRPKDPLQPFPPLNTLDRRR